MAQFYGAPPMALLTVGAGSVLIGHSLLGERAAVDLDWVLWIDLSYKVFTSPRRVRFKEMELGVPRVAAVEAVREVVAAIEASDLRIGFPVELRVSAADDIPLSTASGRESAYLAFHVPAGTEHERYFKLVARVLDGYSARPHWGKLHDLDAELLRTRYPRFDDFVHLRDELDPGGVFTNRYLDRVLGPAAGP